VYNGFKLLGNNNNPPVFLTLFYHSSFSLSLPLSSVFWMFPLPNKQILYCGLKQIPICRMNSICLCPDVPDSFWDS
jgi:hypothetical protein